MNLRSPILYLLALPLLGIVLTGCKTAGTDKMLAAKQALGGGRSPAAPLSVASAAFGSGTALPETHSADGGNVSPPLQWSGAPASTKEFVLIVEDPDAPMPQPFVHWVALRIPAGATSLPADSGSGALVGQGKNSTGGTGYFGPKPPPGKAHRYFFQLF